MRNYLLILLLVFVQSALGKSYFVSPQGDNDGEGTSAEPFRSLHYGMGKLKPGDELVIMDGSYTINRSLRFAGGGQQGKPITIRAEHQGKAFIRTSDNFHRGNVITIGSYNKGHWRRNQAMFFIIDGLDISGGARYGIQTSGGAHVIIRNNTIHGSGNDAIKINHSANHVTVENNEIYNTGVRDRCRSTERFKREHSQQADIENPTALKEIKEIDKPKKKKKKRKHQQKGCNSDGIDITSSGRVIIRNNYLHDILSWGIYTKKGSWDTLIENNRLENIGESGIGIGESSVSYNGLARNNVLLNVKETCLQASGAKDSGFYNNSCINVAQRNGKNWAAMRIAPAENRNGAKSGDTPFSRNVTFQNNLFVIVGDGACLKVTSKSLPGSLEKSLENIHLNHNLCLKDRNSKSTFIFRHKLFDGLTDWQSYTKSADFPQSTDSRVLIVENPLIDSLGDYQAKYATYISLAGKADVNQGKKDFLGNERITDKSKAIDIGAIVVSNVPSSVQ